MEFDLLRTFDLVAKHKNLTRVGDILGLGQPSISRQVRKLEEALKVTLIISYPSGIQLTGEGEYVSRWAAQMMKDMDEYIGFTQGLNDTLAGPLRLISSPFGLHWFSSHMTEFRELYPEIELTVTTDDFMTFPTASSVSGVFVGLTSLPPPRGTPFIWKELDGIHRYPYAHSSYIKKHGMPKSIPDLDHHRIIGYQWSAFYGPTDPSDNPLLYLERPEDNPRKPFMYIDDVSGCRTLLDNGVGIGMLTSYHVRGSNLVRVLEECFEPAKKNVSKSYLVYPPYLKKNKRVRSLIHFINDKMKNHP